MWALEDFFAIALLLRPIIHRRIFGTRIVGGASAQYGECRDARENPSRKACYGGVANTTHITF